MSKPIVALPLYANPNPEIVEIGVDEAGRGPLFGRVYAAAVILPKDDQFEASRVKDSKKFHSKRKIKESAEYIREHALAWHVSFADETTIDRINILQATQQAMHDAILQTRLTYESRFGEIPTDRYQLLIDGNYFNPMTHYNKETHRIEHVPYETVEKGDNTFASIAAASILAKFARDNYIDELCEVYPELEEHYGIASNKGYGTKRHLDGIKEYGITTWHRRSFARCKEYA